MAPPISDKRKLTIEDTLAETGYCLRDAERLLSQRGTPEAYDTIRRTFLKIKKAEVVAARSASGEAKARSLQRQVISLTKTLGQSLEFNDEILAAIHDTAPPLARRIVIPKHAAGSQEVAAVLMLSDWHVGEVVQSQAVGGFNAFNFSICTDRAQFLTRKVAHWVETERYGHNIQDLHVLALGDFITGDLHHGLIQTNEFPPPVAVVKAAYLLADCISTLAPSFRRVHVHEVFMDNHSRLTPKIQWQGGALNTYNYPLYALVNALLVNNQTVKPIPYHAIKPQASINGQEVLLSHGHQLRTWMGLPYYGMQREEGLEATARMKKKAKPYDFHARGHWHSAAVGPFGVVNGALCGMTEYDASAGRYAPACQVSFLLHPHHGLFNWVPWNLETTQ